MTFFWWNDAVQFAHHISAVTKIRHKVYRTGGGWTVDLADAAVLAEPCS